MKKEYDGRIVKLDCKEQIQTVNALLLLFYEKITSFWKQLFVGCTGFVALIVPIAISRDIPNAARKWMLGSVGVALLAAVAIIYPLIKGMLNIKKIHESGRRMLKNAGFTDYAPPYCTKTIVCCIVAFGIAYFGALVLLGVALYSTMS